MAKSLFGDKHDRLRSLLVETRRRRGLTQVQVAAKLRRPQSFVSKYEVGERRLDVIEFLEVARVLDADPCSILKRVIR